MRAFRPILIAAMVAAVLWSTVALAQASAKAPRDNQGRAEVVAYLDDLAGKDGAERRLKVAAVSTRQAAEQRQAEVRAKILRLLGPLPARTQLNAERMGVTQADGFRIEKVLFDSQPGFHVTALLYLPNGRWDRGLR